MNVNQWVAQWVAVSCLTLAIPAGALAEDIVIHASVERTPIDGETEFSLWVPSTSSTEFNERLAALKTYTASDEAGLTVITPLTASSLEHSPTGNVFGILFGPVSEPTAHVSGKVRGTRDALERLATIALDLSGPSTLLFVQWRYEASETAERGAVAEALADAQVRAAGVAAEMGWRLGPVTRVEMWPTPTNDKAVNYGALIERNGLQYTPEVAKATFTFAAEPLPAPAPR